MAAKNADVVNSSMDKLSDFIRTPPRKEHEKVYFARQAKAPFVRNPDDQNKPFGQKNKKDVKEDEHMLILDGKNL